MARPNTTKSVLEQQFVSIFNMRSPFSARMKSIQDVLTTRSKEAETKESLEDARRAVNTFQTAPEFAPVPRPKPDGSVSPLRDPRFRPNIPESTPENPFGGSIQVDSGQEAPVRVAQAGGNPLAGLGQTATPRQAAQTPDAQITVAPSVRSSGREIIDGLVRRGMPPMAAAAFAGNIEQESGFDPLRVNTTGGERGLLQLDPKIRHKALLKFARDKGLDPKLTDTQLDFLMFELETTESSARDAIYAATTLDDATTAISARYFRPGNPMMSQRLDFARSLAVDQPNAPAQAKPSSPGSDQPDFGAIVRALKTEIASSSKKDKPSTLERLLDSASGKGPPELAPLPAPAPAAASTVIRRTTSPLPKAVQEAAAALEQGRGSAPVRIVPRGMLPQFFSFIGSERRT